MSADTQKAMEHLKAANDAVVEAEKALAIAQAIEQSGGDNWLLAQPQQKAVALLVDGDTSPHRASLEHHKRGLSFFTAKQASEADKQRLLYMRFIRAIARENAKLGWVCDWSSNVGKWRFYFDPCDMKARIACDYQSAKVFGHLYMDAEAIDIIKQQFTEDEIVSCITKGAPDLSDSTKGLDIWDKVSATDPSATKAYKGAGGFAGTAISSLYPIKRATEIFGPVGSGWGYEIIEDSYVEGANIVTPDGEVFGKEQTHTIRVKLWAMIDGKRAECEHYGHTPHIFTNKYGVQTDHEAAKKSLTDAIKKALTMWGFSADVFMGQYDDHEYVKAMQEQEALNKAEDKDAEAISQAAEYDTWKETNKSLIQSCVSLNELKALFAAAVKKAKRMNDDNFIKQITKLKDKRKEELEIISQQENES